MANSFEANTINANAITGGTIIAANSIQSQNAVFGNYLSPGYWLDSATGNVRMAGSVSIGNSLTVGRNAQIGDNLAVGNNLNVGTNAQIGGNLNVNGLITTSTLNANTVVTNTIVSAAVTNQGTAYSNTVNQVNYSGNVQTTSEIDTSTQVSIAVTSVTSGALMNITARSMAQLYVNATTSSVIDANLAIIATGGSATQPLGWANSRQTVGAGTITTIPQPAGGVEVYQANYPYVLSGNGTVTVYGLLKGTVVSGNAKILASIFDNYSPSTQTIQLRFTTGQAFKR